MSIFGIDLGTTNSLICNESTGYFSNLVASCVNPTTGDAGTEYFDDMSAIRSYKVDMSMGTEGVVPRRASKCVLRKLAKVASQETGETVHDVVISVPAYFSDSQRAATLESAKEAGLNVRGLVNEPTAAAMYIAKNKKGLFVVFDLGGGTFDCSIIDSRFGSYDVQATSGIVLGGDNLDKVITQHFIKEGGIPFSGMKTAEQRTALQHYASKIKVRMQKEQHPIVVDLSPWSGGVYEFQPNTYEALMRMCFSSAISTMNTLIHKWIPETEVYDILLVGGSTHCPYLRKWIEEVTGKKTAALTYDPDRVVAQGAALYASLIESGDLNTTVSDVTKALSIGLVDGTVSVIVPANSKIPLSMESVFSNPVDAKALYLDLYQGESMLAKCNDKIGQLVYDFDQVVPAHTGHVIVKIDIDSSGVITLSANELLHEPKTITLNRLK